MNEIEKKCKQLAKCDTLRISKPLDRMFVIIGFNRNTKNDEGQWYKNSEPTDFDYVQEQVIANGCSEFELIESVKEYVEFSNMTWEEYFRGEENV